MATLDGMDGNVAQRMEMVSESRLVPNWFLATTYILYVTPAVSPTKVYEVDSVVAYKMIVPSCKAIVAV